jgi:glycosyltransferase involved in cell wall biosynthesis
MSHINLTRPAKPSLALVYWGRRGGGAALTTRIARALADDPRFDLSVSYSVQSEIDPGEFGTIRTFPIETFAGPASFLAKTLAAPAAIERLVGRMSAAGVGTIVTIMPHVWGPLLLRAAHRAGIRTVLLVHDAEPHPGERRPILDTLARREIRASDHIVSLSDHVADRLLARGDVEARHLTRLYHPILDFRAASAHGRDRSGPFRLLFFGRILPYKGLPLLLDAFRRLRAAGLDCTLTVAGRGRIDAPPELRDQPGLMIEQGWVAPGAVGDLLSGADAVVLPYLEASQSGVAAAAYGSGIPVVATPVGGLSEQVLSGTTGILADSITAEAFAGAIRRLIETPGLYETCRAGVARYAEDHSAARFAAALGDAVLSPSAASPVDRSRPNA